MTTHREALTRRRALAGTGALVVGFAITGTVRAQEGQNVQAKPEPAKNMPGSLKTTPLIDSWIRITPAGVTIVTGKVELGQGIKTALLQVAAEELAIQPTNLALITADTSQTPNEGYTAGSQSMQDSATAIRHAAAQAREILIAEASRRLQIPPEHLKADNGAVVTQDGRRLGYPELVSDTLLHIEAKPQSNLKPAAQLAVMGKPMRRVDIPAKVTGGIAYIQDLRPDGMVHARVVRPPSYGARLQAVDTSATEQLPGVLKIVRDGSFLAVVAEREHQAVRAMSSLTLDARWEERETMPAPSAIHDWLTKAPAQERVIADQRSSPVQPATAKTLEATYHRPYQMHGSIGPSCALGLAEGDRLTIWTHSQGVYPLRKSIAGMLQVPEEKVRCIHAEGSGCYGHNGADDVAADAALIARAFPGRPVRVQWMREQEHAWEPYGSAMVARARASLDSTGAIAEWTYEVWSTSHLTRPDDPGNLMPSWHIAKPLAQPVPKPLPQPAGGGDRNAIPLYRFPNLRVVHHFVPEMPVRASALRALGAYANVFALESFMDELARAANADPVAFRLRHLEDERARDVVLLAANKFGWGSFAKKDKDHGRGFAFARYKNLAAYTAVAVEVEVDRESGRVRPVRFVAANDSGQIVNPDGIRNQIEGGIVQSTSWTLNESVGFDRTRILSRDWSTYPILRFASLPDTVEVHLIDRPEQPFLGTGEAAQGPTVAALANAVADATGVRIRDLPFTPDRLRAAVKA
ncbi:MAG TPA: molybdopterin cofactor-binding domain-containing protein [Hyphomicrobiaceae bacterium]|nr:molybdopterin cofactor-binding domain-containing protein [Hyphomicrobiaceae bacterium]